MILDNKTLYHCGASFKDIGKKCFCISKIENDNLLKELLKLMMIDFFYDLSAQNQALIGGLFTFFITTLGASSVFLFKRINRTIMDGFLGIAAGVMIAASFFSLLNPAFDMANNLEMNALIVVTVGFLVGAIFLYFCDKLFDWKLKKHKKYDNKRLSLLIFQ